MQVVDVTNGERFETDTIEGEPGQVEVNGAAARLAEPGDVVVISYALCAEDERPEPTVLSLDEEDRAKQWK